MCIGFYTLAHPDYALILCANRDEYLERPTATARWHSFQPIDSHEVEGGVILSGRDGLAGGTWLGMHRTGKLALLTNITEPGSVYSTSRGDLASKFLLSAVPLEDFSAQLTAKENWASYAGFNMLLLEPTICGEGNVAYDGHYASNSGGGGVITSRALRDDEKRCGGITNGVESLDGERWPKLVDGKAQLEKVLQGRDVEDGDTLIESLAEILSTRSNEPIRAREDLRKTIRVEPLRLASGQQYGTRLATFVLVKRSGEVTFVERDVWQHSPASKESATPVLGSRETDRVVTFRISSNETGVLTSS